MEHLLHASIKDINKMLTRQISRENHFYFRYPIKKNLVYVHNNLQWLTKIVSGSC